MIDTDEDGDAIMDQKNNADTQSQIMDHVTRVGRDVVTAVVDRLANVRDDVQDTAVTVHSQPHSGRSLPPQRDDGGIIIQLKGENETLKEKLQLSQASFSSLEAEMSRRERTSRDLEGALQKRNLDVKRLNTIIIKGAAPIAGPSDDEFRLGFCDIRTRIFKIVRSHYQATSISLSNLRTDSPEQKSRQRHWLSNWSKQNPEVRNYRVQGAMFEIINLFIFSKAVYGFDTEMDKPLRMFEEKMIASPDISKADFLEWRRRTVTAAKIFRPVHPQAAERYAKKIQETLELALTPSSRPMPRAKDQLTRELQALCEAALQLSLDLRSSKAIFRVTVPEKGTTMEDSSMELVAVDGTKSSTSPSSEVLFTVFGGLEKTTLIPGDDEAVENLEKAHVVGLG